VLFHVLNLAREKGASVLITTETPPGDLAIELPDLRSRLRGLPLVMIEAPDEALLKAVLVKLFADRQLPVEPHVIAHLALHMDRSMDAANRVVEAADRLALARQRRVTRALAAEALEWVRGAANQAE
jgi:chromosomal replication initiation ATPase DnaA